MDKPIGQAVTEGGELAASKALLAKDWPRMLASSVLAGVFLVLGAVFMLAMAGPLEVAGSPWRTAVLGFYGLAIVMVLFAGADMYTSNVMTVMFGWLRRSIGFLDGLRVLVLSLIGNLIGCVVAGAVVGWAHLVNGEAPGALLGSLMDAKTSLTGNELFLRAILANMLVCLAVWMTNRVKGRGAGIFLLLLPIFAFVDSGMAHSVANMALYVLGIGNGQAHIGDLARDLAFVVPGNFVGGALVAAAYWFLAGRKTAAAASSAEALARHEDPAPGRDGELAASR